MKIIFFGLGSIGLRHAVLLQKHFKHDLYAFRSGKKDRGNELGIPEVLDWDALDQLNPDVAFITNPTSMHVSTVRTCLEKGMKIFLEKPIGRDLTGLDDLTRYVKRKRCVSYVAYVLRFHPVLKKLQKIIEENDVMHMRVITTSYLPTWRKNARNH